MRYGLARTLVMLQKLWCTACLLLPSRQDEVSLHAEPHNIQGRA